MPCLSHWVCLPGLPVKSYHSPILATHTLVSQQMPLLAVSFLNASVSMSHYFHCHGWAVRHRFACHHGHTHCHMPLPATCHKPPPSRIRSSSPHSFLSLPPPRLSLLSGQLTSLPATSCRFSVGQFSACLPQAPACHCLPARLSLPSRLPACHCLPTQPTRLAEFSSPKTGSLQANTTGLPPAHLFRHRHHSLPHTPPPSVSLRSPATCHCRHCPPAAVSSSSLAACCQSLLPLPLPLPPAWGRPAARHWSSIEWHGRRRLVTGRSLPPPATVTTVTTVTIIW